jgi:hypothetical protein
MDFFHVPIIIFKKLSLLKSENNKMCLQSLVDVHEVQLVSLHHHHPIKITFKLLIFMIFFKKQTISDTGA